jgi:serine/threonine-protein kinase Chk2
MMQQSQGEEAEAKKVRRAERAPSPDAHHHIKQGQQQLPSPVTYKHSTVSDEGKQVATPPTSYDTAAHASESSGPGRHTPPQSDTQPFSQFVHPPQNRTYAVEDEEGEQVWGYLVPFDARSDDALVLRRREACPVPEDIVGPRTGNDKVGRHTYERQEEFYEKEKAEKGVTAGGYLIGRHRECGKSSQAQLQYAHD